MASYTKNWVAVGFFFVLHGVMMGSWMSRVPAIKDHLHFDGSTMGFALMAMTIGMVTGGLLGGPLCGRFGTGRTTRGLGVFCGLWLVALGLAWNFYVLFAALLVQGFALSVYNLAMNAQATELERQMKRPIFSKFHAIWSLGALSGALIGSGFSALEVAPWLHFLVVGSMMAAGGAWLSKHLLYTGTSSGSRKMIVPNRQLLILGAMGFAAVITDNASSNWGGIYLKSLGVSESVAALTFFVHQTGMFVGRSMVDNLSQRFGPHRVLRASMVLAVVGFGAGVASGTIAGAFIGIGLMGLGISASSPSLFAAAGRVVPNNVAGAIGLLSIFSSSGAVLGNPTIGKASDVFGLQASIVVAACMGLVVAALARHIDTKKA